jgi:hypothetical protein
MDSYSNKINKIKSTIDEIREDIEVMKNVLINLHYTIFSFFRKTKKR